MFGAVSEADIFPPLIERAVFGALTVVSLGAITFVGYYYACIYENETITYEHIPLDQLSSEPSCPMSHHNLTLSTQVDLHQCVSLYPC